MPDSLYQALRPVSVMSQLFGQSVFEYPEGRPRTFLSVVYVLALWIAGSAINFYYVANYPSYLLFDSSVSASMVFTNVITAVIATLAGFSYSQNLRGCIRALTRVDETLMVLGVPADYTATFKYNMRLMMMWMAIVVVLNMSGMTWMWMTVSERMGLIFWVPIGNGIYLTNCLVDIYLGTILRCVESRFDRLNGCIEKLSKGGRREPRWCQSMFHASLVRRDPHRDEMINRVIWVAMHLHLELRRISRELNKVFQTQMSVQTACSFYVKIGLAVIIYNAFPLENLEATYYIVMSITWFAFSLLKLILINIAFENVCSKETATMAIFHKLMNTMRDLNERKEVTQFTLQMMHNPLKFTGFGFFCFGYNFIQKFCASMTTVFVIILQTNVNKFVYSYAI